jgi:hypothetical protein
MIETLITSKTRVKLLLKFFLNPNNSAYLRGLESEFGDSTNAIRQELNRLEEADMLKSEMNGNKKLFRVNMQHPLYDEINGIVRKYFGLDLIVENVVKRLGNLKCVYLTGDILSGKDSGIIDLIFVGEVDQAYLVSLIEKVEGIISRRVRYLIMKPEELEPVREQTHLLIWRKEG